MPQLSQDNLALVGVLETTLAKRCQHVRPVAEAIERFDDGGHIKMS